MSIFIDKLEKFLTVELFFGYIYKSIEIVIILVVSRITIKLGNKFITKVIKRKRNKSTNRRKVDTLQTLLKSILRYGIYFFATMLILSILQIPIGSLLAGAGIVGVALGFGAQNLVKDIINGFFVLFEDQFWVGDYVKIANIEGIVEEIELRTTTIRSFSGEINILPNRLIEKVTNYSVGNMRVMIDVGVSYEESPEKVFNILEDLCKEISREKNNIITEGPDVLGIQDFASSSMVIRIWAMVKPMEQWQIGRYIRKRVKEKFDEINIEIPYQHVVLMEKEQEEVEPGESRL